MITKIILAVGMMSQAIAMTKNDFKPERIGRSSSFIVEAPIAKAFPLFGPIQEMKWAAGWEPHVIFPWGEEVAERMVFTTQGPEGQSYLWAITTFQPEHYNIEYTVSTKDRIWFISVVCLEQGQQTQVNVTYTYTGLTESGHVANQAALARMFAHDLKDWEQAINYYLKTGQQLH